MGAGEGEAANAAIGETLVSVTVGRRAFVTVQAMAEPGAVCAAVKSIARWWC